MGVWIRQPQRHLVNTFYFSLAVMLIGFLQPAHAQWSSRASQYAYDTFTKFPASGSFDREESSFLATMWGGVNRNIIGHTFWRPRAVDVSSPYFKKSIRMYVDIHKRQDKKIIYQGGRPTEVIRYSREKAPLIVFIPGVFADADNSSARHFMNAFAQMGYHVLTLSNPWGPDYIRAEPVERVPSPQLEGEVVIELTRRAIRDTIGAEWVSDVHIAGESLGASIAAIAYGLDSIRQDRGIFNGTASLFWPPISMSKSISTLDHYIGLYKPAYVNNCSTLSHSLGMLYRAITGAIIFNPSPVEEECAGPLVIHHAFRRSLVANAETLDGMRGYGRSLELKGDDRARWELDMTFNRYIHEYSGDFARYIETNDQTTQLFYWLKMAASNGRHRAQIFTSADDFINFQDNWSANLGKEFEEGKSVILAPWGGHVGLTFQSNFDRFMALQYSLPKR